MVLNALSFDLEHWYTATLLRDEVTDPDVQIERSTELVLGILDDHDVAATFFVVGEIAERYPELIRRIEAAGHEVGSHGHTHTPLFELTPEQFRRELLDSRAAIAAAIGTPPSGFRAPNFSVTPRTSWAFEILAECGFEYDSSVFPVRTPMYGVNEAPLAPYAVDPDSPFEQSGVPLGGSLTEVPMAVFHPRLRLPIAGGFYARLLPTRAVARGIRNLNAHGLPAILYFHPWEFNPDIANGQSGIAAHKRFISFHGIDTLASKLDRLLDAFEFGRIDAVVADERAEDSVAVGSYPSP